MYMRLSVLSQGIRHGHSLRGNVDIMSKLLELAVKQALNIPADNVVSAKVPSNKKGKVAKVALKDMNLSQYDTSTDETLCMYFDETRRSALELFCVGAQNICTLLETEVPEIRAEMMAQCPIIFPSGKVSYNEWKALGAYLKGRSEYQYKEMVTAVKALSKMKGKLPSADGKGKAGKRTVSPSTWHATLARELAKVSERMTKCPAKDVDRDALQAFAKALKAIEAAEKSLARSIARNKAA